MEGNGYAPFLATLQVTVLLSHPPSFGRPDRILTDVDSLKTNSPWTLDDRSIKSIIPVLPRVLRVTGSAC